MTARKNISLKNKELSKRIAKEAKGGPASVPSFAHVAQPSYLWHDFEPGAGAAQSGLTLLPTTKSDIRAAIISPSGSDPLSRHIRTHELLHARFSPASNHTYKKLAKPDAKSGRPVVSWVSAQIAEDIRLIDIAHRRGLQRRDAYITAEFFLVIAERTLLLSEAPTDVVARVLSFWGQPCAALASFPGGARAVEAGRKLVELAPAVFERYDGLRRSGAIGDDRGVRWITDAADPRTVALFRALETADAIYEHLTEGAAKGFPKAAAKRRKAIDDYVTSLAVNTDLILSRVEDELSGAKSGSDFAVPSGGGETGSPSGGAGDSGSSEADEAGEHVAASDVPDGSGAADGDGGSSSSGSDSLAPSSAVQRYGSKPGKSNGIGVGAAYSRQKKPKLLSSADLTSESRVEVGSGIYVPPDPVTDSIKTRSYDELKSRLREAARGLAVDESLVDEGSYYDLEARDTDEGFFPDMDILQPRLDRYIKVKSLGRGRAALDGTAPKHIHRWAADRHVFDARGLRSGGTLLIDVSGSMSWAHESTLSLIEQCPSITVALYSGPRMDIARSIYSSSLPSKEPLKGVLSIIARGGRAVGKDWEQADHHGGWNLVDGPALAWLARQPGPRVWFCDGGVTGIDRSSFAATRRGYDTAHASLTSEAFRIAALAGVTRTTSLTEVRGIFAGKLPRRPVKWEPGQGTMWYVQASNPTKEEEARIQALRAER